MRYDAFINGLLVVFCLLAIQNPRPAQAQIPPLINFQAAVDLPNSTVPAVFELFGVATGGTNLWTEERNVDIEEGLLHVTLGEVSNESLAEVFESEDELYLQITLDGEPFNQRFQLTSVGYALRARIADKALSAGSSLAAADGDPSEALIVDTAGNIGIGTDDPRWKVHAVTIGSGYLVERIVGTDTQAGNGGYFGFRRARGAIGSPEPVLNGDFLGQITWNGYHPNSKYLGVTGPAEAAISARVEGDVSENNMPTSLLFSTKDTGELTNDIRMVIKHNGNVGIGTENPVEAFQIGSRWTFHDGGSKLIGYNVDVNDGDKRIVNDEASVIRFNSGGDISLETSGAGAEGSEITWHPTLVLRNDGRVGIGTGTPKGALDVNGQIYQRSGNNPLHADYVFEPQYQLESIEEHAEFMWSEKHLKAIPRAQKDSEGREVVNVGEHRRGIVEELEKAHIYIQQLHERIKKLEEKIEALN